MHTSALSSEQLERRLEALVGDERRVLVEFLVTLSEFDRRDVALSRGYNSTFAYLTEKLRYSKPAAGRRIRTARLLVTVPQVADYLADGRLWLTTACVLSSILTASNATELLDRASGLDPQEAERLKLTIRPEPPPRDLIRQLPTPARSSPVTIDTTQMSWFSPADRPETRPPSETATPAHASASGPANEPLSPVSAAAAASPSPLPTAAEASVPQLGAAVPMSAPQPVAAASTIGPLPAATVASPYPQRIRPASAELDQFRMTVPREFTTAFRKLRDLVSHKFPSGVAHEVLYDAIQIATDHYTRLRLGSGKKRRKRSLPPVRDSRYIPIEYRAEVWKRDDGCCAFVGTDGKRCGSTWQIQFDHSEESFARGGAPTPENLRLLCGAHNRYRARQEFGRAFVARKIGDG